MSRTIAQFSDYDGLLNAVRARVRELEVNGEAFDEFAGFPRGYLSKLIGVRPSRRIANISMGPLFTALGVLCVMVEDEATTERIKKRLRPRNKAYVRRAPRILLTDRQWRERQRNGRKIRWEKLTPIQRSEIMRVLAERRWRQK